MDAIVNLAPTGMIPTKAMTPHVPLTPEEIAADVLACADLGITTAHLHARDESGDPTYRKGVYARIIGLIRDRRDDLVLCVSCSGRNWSELEKRAEVLELDGDLKPDMASLTLSSLNFANSSSVNAPETVQGLAERMRDRGIKPELEIFDLGMANYAKYLLRKEIIEGRLYANLFFGNIASAQPTLLELGILIEALPPDTVWAAAGLGEAQLPMNAVAIAYGGGVRVGLEDNIWFDRTRSRLATNVELVGRIHEIGRLHAREVMAPAAFRELMMLGRVAGG
jgi:uncharacterized protein (DUF849 family)